MHGDAYSFLIIIMQTISLRCAIAILCNLWALASAFVLLLPLLLAFI